MNTRNFKIAAVTVLSLILLMSMPLGRVRQTIAQRKIGASPVAAAEQKGAVLNVRDYGAKGDGISFLRSCITCISRFQFCDLTSDL